ncbi:MAG TPA: hypothetical protein VFS92_06910, partial [Planctomycetota bacterium]|nr:hypothetical protein [Planctomycetota bacterium]
AAGAEGVVLRLEPLTGAISGQVAHVDGGPLTAGIPLRAEAVDSTLPDVQIRTTEGGRFAFENLGTAAYRIRAGGPGSEFAWDGEWPVIAPGTSDAVLRVRRGEVLRGTLLGPDGGPPHEKLVLFVPVADGGEVRHIVDVGQDGKFEVKGLPAGPIKLILLRFGVPDRDAPEVARVRVPCAPLDLRVPREEE